VGGAEETGEEDDGEQEAAVAERRRHRAMAVAVLRAL
jgi:hypothetical protein